jgi:hypothetical protein
METMDIIKKMELFVASSAIGKQRGKKSPVDA